MDIRSLMREDILDLVAYEPHPYSDVIKMDANENPHPFPKEVISEIVSALAGDIFSRYPDPMGDELREKIAGFNGVKAENIVLGNGSDELIQLILQTFGGPGKRVIIPVPTFSMYKIHGQVTGTEAIEVPRDEQFALNIDGMLTEMNHPAARVTFIATPNNPTGNTVPVEVMEELAKRSKSLVVADEAYIDFGGQTCLGLVAKYPNLIVLRTFSKIGLAGLRIGCLIAQPAVTRELHKVRQPYNVNAVSQAAAKIVLDRWDIFRRQIEEIMSERDRLAAKLKEIPGLEVYPSLANFVMFRVPVSSTDLHQQLLDRGVLVRMKLGVTHGLEECLRVTVGTREENALFLEKLKESLIS